jgi:peptide chain release factor 2
MKMLKAALYQRALEEQEKEKQKLESTKTDIAFGSQIRSYVFQPYTMVNDHRTELKIPDVQKVMDGDLDPFIQAYLREYGAEHTAQGT